MLAKEKKQELITAHGANEKDSGKSEVQIAILSTRIQEITAHLKLHPKDYAARLGLLKLVGKRRRLLNYLTKVDIERYRSIIKELGIRK